MAMLMDESASMVNADDRRGFLQHARIPLQHAAHVASTADIRPVSHAHFRLSCRIWP